MSNFSILEVESPPPTAVAAQFVIVQYSSKIPLSLCSLRLSASLFFQVHPYLYPKRLFICIYLLEKAFAFWVQFYLLFFNSTMELALSHEKLANESCSTCRV